MEDTIIEGQQELKSAIKGYNGAIVSMSKERFTEWANSLSIPALKLILAQHRENRDFYKRVLGEEYHKEHPDSHRYQSSESNVKKYNRQGKVLSEIIANKSQTKTSNN